MRYFAILFLIFAATAAGQQSAAPRTDNSWEKLPDGSLGRETEFRGVDDLVITAYVRKPAGPGPFPAIVWMHGGKDSKQSDDPTWAEPRVCRCGSLPNRDG